MKQLIVFIVMSLMYSCDFKDNRIIAQTRIDQADVEKIVITKMQQTPDSVQVFKKELSEKSVTFFIEKWNGAEPIGMCKYIPNCWVEVVLKNGRKRNFRINGSTIKERNDYCYNTEIPAFSEILWYSDESE